MRRTDRGWLAVMAAVGLAWIAGGFTRADEDQAERAGREILAHLNHPNFHYAVTPHDLAHAVLERHVWKAQRRQAWTQPVGWQPSSTAVDGRPPR